MKKFRTIYTEQAPKVVGPYSQAIITPGYIFCSGQIGLNPSTGNLEEGIENQTTQVLKNLQAVIKEAGANLSDVVKTTIYLTSMQDYVKVNEIYSVFFNEHRPARSTVAVSQLPKNALVEIECVVYNQT